MIKSELRKIYLEKRRSLTANERAEHSQRIADRFFRGFDLSSVKTLHCFIPIDKFNEINTLLVYEKIWNDLPSVLTVAPRADRETGEMKNFVFGAETDLVENEWGILEPEAGESVDPSQVDMVLVPLLCFDRRGYRVGYGKGFYDRFLEKCRPDCVKVGLSYFPPVDEIDDPGSHDIALDHCVTSEMLYRFDTKKDG